MTHVLGPVISSELDVFDVAPTAADGLMLNFVARARIRHRKKRNEERFRSSGRGISVAFSVLILVDTRADSQVPSRGTRAYAYNVMHEIIFDIQRSNSKAVARMRAREYRRSTMNQDKLEAASPFHCYILLTSGIKMNLRNRRINVTV